MAVNAKTERFELIELFGIPMLFECGRIDKTTVPEGLHVYSVRHDDECQGIPCEVCEWVMVNHWGDVISAAPLSLTPNKRGTNSYLDIDEDKDWNYTGETWTLEEYIQTYGKKA